MVKYKNIIESIVAPIVTFIIILFIWQAIIVIFNIETFLLPSPIIIAQRCVEYYDEILPHFIITLQTVLVGFSFAVVFGIMLAFIITNYSIVNSALSPFVIILVTTPLITLMPLLMISFGFTIPVRMFGVFLQAFPIVNMNAATGYSNVPNLRIELMKSLGANKIQTFKEAVFPSALTDIFTGIKLCTIFSVTGTIGVEFTSSNNGLGSRILYYTDFYKADLAFACIFYVALIGVFLYSSVVIAEKLIVKIRN